jgi:hypothetical protein
LVNGNKKVAQQNKFAFIKMAFPSESGVYILSGRANALNIEIGDYIEVLI